MRKLSYHEKLVLHLADSRGEWFPSFALSKVETKYGWVGSSGERRMRELAEDGKITIEGQTFFIERRKQGKYTEYRVTAVASAPKEVATIVEKNGQRVVQLSLHEAILPEAQNPPTSEKALEQDKDRSRW